MTVPLEGRDGVLLGFSGGLQGAVAAAEPREAGGHGLALTPAAASAAGRCMAATGVVHAFAPTAGCADTSILIDCSVYPEYCSFPRLGPVMLGKVDFLLSTAAVRTGCVTHLRNHADAGRIG